MSDYTRVLDDLATPSEAGEAFGYSASHVRLLADTGKIVARRYSSGWLVSKSSLNRYVNRQNMRKTA